MTATSSEWFEVDREGLAAVLARRGAWFVVYELIQNAIDEDGVTAVTVTLEPVAGRPLARLVVTDDAPDGFADLTHAFRLFAPSKKKGDAEKRGRFNLGEKLVLAVCDSATITSTKGTYQFDGTGRHHIPRLCRPAGSEFNATIRMTRADVEETGRRVFSILPPAGITLTYNGQPVERREPLHTFTVNLPTEIAGDDGQLRATARNTLVSVYEPLGDEEPMIYEMGIPVVATGDAYHVDVAQKVPLNMDRDNVTPAYLRRVRTAVVNEMHARLTGDDATATWVKEALGSKDIAPEAVEAVVTKLYGADAVVFDPSDLEANKLAAAQGRTVIPARAFDKATWANVRSTGMFRPAGQIAPSNSSITTSPEGKPPVPVDEWTPGIIRVVEYARQVGKVLVGREPEVTVHRAVTGQRWAAAYSPGHLLLNLGQLGHRWFDQPDVEAVDALLIHEYAHHVAVDHLSSLFYDECCRLGARLKARASEVTF